MFCPEDGTELQPRRSNSETTVYETCPECGCSWSYVEGCYAADGLALLALMEPDEEEPVEA